MFDGFPVDEISMTHWCLANCSIAEEHADQSEALLRVVCIARKPESNLAFREMVLWNGVQDDFNLLVNKGFIETVEYGRLSMCVICPLPNHIDALPHVHAFRVHSRLWAGADKVGVEKHRGCRQSNPWSTSPSSQRMLMPWEKGKAPLTWQGCYEALLRVCDGLLPNDETLGLLSHETLQPGQMCMYCKQVPFIDADAKRARRQLHATMKADQTRKGKAAYASMRKIHADTHGNQHEFQCNPLKGGMTLFVPDALHVYDINLGYQFQMQVIWRVCDGRARERVSEFFSGMGVRLDCRKKGGGRSKWMKASLWAAMCLGSSRFPGGITSWLPSLVVVIGDCMPESSTFATSKNVQESGVSWP
jgi:hypothetical protein